MTSRPGWVALTLVMALVATACSADPETETASTESDGSESTEGSDELEGTLTYFSMWNDGEPQQEVLTSIIEEFEDTYPAVEVEVNWAGREVLTPTRAAMSSGDAPDLVDQVAEQLSGALIKDGETLGLGAVLDMEIPDDGGNTVRDVIPESFLDLYVRDGEPQLVPYSMITSGIWYDEQKLSQLGIDEPTTWDEFLAAVDTAVSEGEVAVQADGLEINYNLYWLSWLVMREGGPGTLSAAVSDETGELWKSDVMVTAAEGVEALVTSSGLNEGYSGSAWPLAQDAWARGEGVFQLNGSWLPSETADAASEEFVYRMLPFPTTDAGHETTEVIQIGWVVPSGSEDLDLAEAFIAFALQRDRLSGISTVAKNMTPRSDIAAPVEIQDAADELASGKPAHLRYDGVQGDFPDYWNTVLLPINDRLFFGEISAEEFIDEISDATTDFWANQ